MMSFLQKGSEERSLVGLHLLFAFLIGSAQTLLAVIPLAIFLTSYSSSLLTYVYMSMGVIIFLIGNVFRYFQKNLPFFRLLLSPLLIFAFSLFLFWGLLVVAPQPWVPMALFIWASVAYTFLSLVLSNLLLRVFSLQEGKKFYGIIGGTRALGGTLIGFLIPILVSTLGAKTSFLIAPVFILGAILALFAINKKHSDRFLEQKSLDKEKSEKISFKTIKNRRFVINIFLLAVVSIFNFYSLDLLFNTTVKHHYISQAEIAGFLGIFTAISNIFTLLAGFFLFSFVLNRLGLMITLFLSPVIVGILTAITLMTDLVPATVGLVFGLILVTVLFERMMRQSINGEALNLLYAPLRPDVREWAQLQYRINIQSLSTTLVGVILFGLNRTWGTSIKSIGWFVMAVSACGVISMLYVQKNYIRILVDALSRWALFKPQFTELDKDSLKIVKSRLQSRYPEEVVYALQLIETAEPKEFPSALEEALKNPLLDVRLYTLKKIEEYRIKGLIEKVKEICLTEKDPMILGQALRALAAIMPADQFYFFKNFEEISGGLIGEILYGPADVKKRAIDRLALKEKFEIAEVLKEIDIPNKADLLLPLLSDPDPEVRLVACLAAGQVKDNRIYPLLIENLTIPHLHNAAAKSLLNLAPIEEIARSFGQFTREQQHEVLYLLSWMEGEKVTAFLQQFLQSPDPRLFHEAVRALKNRHFKAENREQISSLLAEENQNILSLKAMIGALPTEKAKLLRDLLIREMELCQKNCFAMLTFIYHKTPILSAKGGLTESDRNKYSYAIEILEQTLGKEHTYLLPQLIQRSLPENPQPIESVLQDVLKVAPNCYIPAIHSAVLYTIGALGLKSLTELVKKGEAPNDPFMEEIRPWALKKL